MKNLTLMMFLTVTLAACGGDGGTSGSGTSDSASTPGAKASAGVAANGSQKPDEAEAYAKAYTVCAACHLPTGDGVPGAFPPIRNRTAGIARLDGGREYLITAVAHGLMGSLSVNGQTYMGVMPGHAGSMSDLQIAQALNHTIFALSDNPVDDVTPFSESEVATQRAAVSSPSPASGMKLREALVKQHGQAWP